MASIIQIKRSATQTIPTSLAVGEMAYSYADSANSPGTAKLYIGIGPPVDSNVLPNIATQIVTIGGEFYTNLLGSGTPGISVGNQYVLLDSNRKIDYQAFGNLVADSGTISKFMSDSAAIAYADIDSAHILTLSGRSITFDSGTISQFTADSARLTYAHIETSYQPLITGPDQIVIDPSGIGDNTGRVLIKGDLQVDGTQTIVNSTTVSTNDINITVADSAVDSAAADGAGLSVYGDPVQGLDRAHLKWNATTNKWNVNPGIVTPTIDADSGRVRNVSGQHLYYNTGYINQFMSDSGRIEHLVTNTQHNQNIETFDTNTTQNLVLRSSLPQRVLFSDSIDIVRGVDNFLYVESDLANDNDNNKYFRDDKKEGLFIGRQRLRDSGYYNTFIGADGTVRGTTFKFGEDGKPTAVPGGFDGYTGFTYPDMPSMGQRELDFYGLEIRDSGLFSTLQQNVFKTDMSVESAATLSLTGDSLGMIRILGSLDSSLIELRKDGSINFVGGLFQDNSEYIGGGLFKPVPGNTIGDVAYRPDPAVAAQTGANPLGLGNRLAYGIAEPKLGFDITSKSFQVSAKFDPTTVASRKLFPSNLQSTATMAAFGQDIDDSNKARLLFDGNAARFRAGYFDYEDVHVNNMGLYSNAFGFSSRAFGDYSFAAGDSAKALSNYSIAMGQKPLVSSGAANGIVLGGLSSVNTNGISTPETQFAGAAIGFNNNITGDLENAIAIGRSNTLATTASWSSSQSHYQNVAIGIDNSVSSTVGANVILGANNKIFGDGNVTIGGSYDDGASGSNKIGVTGVNSTANYTFGQNNTVAGSFNFTIGEGNTVVDVATQRALTFGHDNTVSADDAIVFGRQNTVAGEGSMAFGRGINITAAADYSAAMHLSGNPADFNEIKDANFFSIQGGNVSIGSESDMSAIGLASGIGNLYVDGDVIYTGHLLKRAGAGAAADNPWTDDGSSVTFTQVPADGSKELGINVAVPYSSTEIVTDYGNSHKGGFMIHGGWDGAWRDASTNRNTEAGPATIEMFDSAGGQSTFASIASNNPSVFAYYPPAGILRAGRVKVTDQDQDSIGEGSISIGYFHKVHSNYGLALGGKEASIVATSMTADHFGTIISSTSSKVGGVGGNPGTNSGLRSFIIGGSGAEIGGSKSAILNSEASKIDSDAEKSIIISASSSNVYGDKSVILGGQGSTIGGAKSAGTSATPTYSMILNSVSSTIDSASDYSTIINGNSSTRISGQSSAIIGHGIVEGNNAAIIGKGFIDGNGSFILGYGGTTTAVVKGDNSLLIGKGTIRGNNSAMVGTTGGEANGNNSLAIGGSGSKVHGINSISIANGTGDNYIRGTKSVFIGHGNTDSSAATSAVFGTPTSGTRTRNFFIGRNNVVDSAGHAVTDNYIFGHGNVVSTTNAQSVFLIGKNTKLNDNTTNTIILSAPSSSANVGKNNNTKLAVGKTTARGTMDVAGGNIYFGHKSGVRVADVDEIGNPISRAADSFDAQLYINDRTIRDYVLDIDGEDVVLVPQPIILPLSTVTNIEQANPAILVVQNTNGLLTDGTTIRFSLPSVTGIGQFLNDSVYTVTNVVGGLGDSFSLRNFDNTLNVSTLSGASRQKNTEIKTLSSTLGDPNYYDVSQWGLPNALPTPALPFGSYISLQPAPVTTKSPTRFANSVIIDSDLVVKGTVTFQDSLSVAKDAIINGNLDVQTGYIDGGGHLNIASFATFGDSVNVSGRLTVDGPFTGGTFALFTDSITMAGDLSGVENLTASGTGTFGDSVNITGKLTVSDSISVGGSVSIVNNLTIGGSVRWLDNSYDDSFYIGDMSFDSYVLRPGSKIFSAVTSMFDTDYVQMRVDSENNWVVMPDALVYNPNDVPKAVAIGLSNDQAWTGKYKTMQDGNIYPNTFQTTEYQLSDAFNKGDIQLGTTTGDSIGLDVQGRVNVRTNAFYMANNTKPPIMANGVGWPTKGWMTQDNYIDRPYILSIVDSGHIKGIADSDHIKSAANKQWIQSHIDSAFVISIWDSDYYWKHDSFNAIYIGVPHNGGFGAKGTRYDGNLKLALNQTGQHATHNLDIIGDGKFSKSLETHGDFLWAKNNLKVGNFTGIRDSSVNESKLIGTRGLYVGDSAHLRQGVLVLGHDNIPNGSYTYTMDSQYWNVKQTVSLNNANIADGFNLDGSPGDDHVVISFSDSINLGRTIVRRTIADGTSSNLSRGVDYDSLGNRALFDSAVYGYGQAKYDPFMIDPNRLKKIYVKETSILPTDLSLVAREMHTGLDENSKNSLIIGKFITAPGGGSIISKDSNFLDDNGDSLSVQAGLAVHGVTDPIIKVYKEDGTTLKGQLRKGIDFEITDSYQVRVFTDTILHPGIFPGGVGLGESIDDAIIKLDDVIVIEDRRNALTSQTELFGVTNIYGNITLGNKAMATAARPGYPHTGAKFTTHDSFIVKGGMTFEEGQRLQYNDDVHVDSTKTFFFGPKTPGDITTTTLFEPMLESDGTGNLTAGSLVHARYNGKSQATDDLGNLLYTTVAESDNYGHILHTHNQIMRETSMDSHIINEVASRDLTIGETRTILIGPAVNSAPYFKAESDGIGNLLGWDESAGSYSGTFTPKNAGGGYDVDGTNGNGPDPRISITDQYRISIDSHIINTIATVPTGMSLSTDTDFTVHGDVIVKEDLKISQNLYLDSAHRMFTSTPIYYYKYDSDGNYTSPKSITGVVRTRDTGDYNNYPANQKFTRYQKLYIDRVDKVIQQIDSDGLGNLIKLKNADGTDKIAQIGLDSHIERIIDSDYIGVRLETPWNILNVDDGVGGVQKKIYYDEYGAVIVGQKDALLIGDLATKFIVDSGNAVFLSSGIDASASEVHRTKGQVPNFGTKPRMMWIPKRGAFRVGGLNVGSITGRQNDWEDSNVGYSSIGIGNNTKASAFSTAVGYDVVAGVKAGDPAVTPAENETSEAVAFGHTIKSPHSASIALGSNITHHPDTQYTDIGILSIGTQLQSRNAGNVSIGKGISLPQLTDTSGSYENILAIGEAIQLYGKTKETVAIGRGLTTSGDNANNTVLIGRGVNSTGANNGLAIGYNTSGTASLSGAISATHAVSIGRNTVAASAKALSIGYGASVTGTKGIEAVSIGRNTSVTANYGFALGTSTSVSGNATNSIAIGISSTVSSNARDALVIGKSSSVSSNATGSVVVGQSSSIGSNMRSSVALGVGNNMTGNGTGAVAMGYFVNVSGTSGTRVGIGANVTAKTGVAIGLNSSASGAGSNSVAIGSGNYASYGGVAIGKNVSQSGSGSGFAIGRDITTSSKGMVIGINSSATRSSLAIGSGATASGTNSVSIGTGTVAGSPGGSKQNIVAVGFRTSVTGNSTNSINIGSKNSISTNRESVAVGSSNIISGNGTRGIALGIQNVVSKEGIAIGRSNRSTKSQLVMGVGNISAPASGNGDWEITIGSYNTGNFSSNIIGKLNTNNTRVNIFGNNNTGSNSGAQSNLAKSYIFGITSTISTGGGMVYGKTSNVSHEGQSYGIQNTVTREGIAFGYLNNINNAMSSATMSMAYGRNNTANSQGIAFGYNNTVTNSGIAFGRDATADENGIALGRSLTAYGANNLALGSNITIGAVGNVNLNSVAIGLGTTANTATETGVFSVQGGQTTLSVTAFDEKNNVPATNSGGFGHQHKNLLKPNPQVGTPFALEVNGPVNITGTGVNGNKNELYIQGERIIDYVQLFAADSNWIKHIADAPYVKNIINKEYLRTTQTSDQFFHHNNTHLNFNGQGNVGIQIANNAPQYNLDVNGSVNFGSLYWQGDVVIPSGGYDSTIYLNHYTNEIQYVIAPDSAELFFDSAYVQQRQKFGGKGDGYDSIAVQSLIDEIYINDLVYHVWPDSDYIDGKLDSAVSEAYIAFRVENPVGIGQSRYSFGTRAGNAQFNNPVAVNQQFYGTRTGIGKAINNVNGSTVAMTAGEDMLDIMNKNLTTSGAGLGVAGRVVIAGPSATSTEPALQIFNGYIEVNGERLTTDKLFNEKISYVTYEKTKNIAIKKATADYDFDVLGKINADSGLYIGGVDIADIYDSDWVESIIDLEFLKSVVDSDYIHSAADSTWIKSDVGGGVTQSYVQGFIDSTHIHNILAGGMNDLLVKNITPDNDLVYDLGSPTRRFKDLYLSNSTINLGSISLSATATDGLSVKDSGGNTLKFKGIDSDAASGMIDSAYVQSRANSEYVRSVADSAYILSAADSEYVEHIIHSRFNNLNTSIIPLNDVVHDLGSPTKRFRDLYLSGNSLNLGGTTLSAGPNGMEVKDANGIASKVIGIDSNVAVPLIISNVLSTANEAYIKGFANEAYIKGFASEAYIKGFADSAYIKGVADSAYIKDVANEAYITSFIDSAYITLHSDVDSAFVSGLISNIGVTDTRIGSQNINFGPHTITADKLVYNNAYPNLAALPNANNYQGNFVLENGVPKYSYAGNWITIPDVGLVKLYADSAAAALVDAAPDTLNTLNELAAALGDDANFSTTLTTSIAAKLPLAGGTMTGALDMGSNNITTTGKMLFANVYSTEGDLPSASTYHGMFAHVHGTGAAYYAHAGAWVKLANNATTIAGYGITDAVDSFGSISNIPTTIAGYGITDAVDSFGSLTNKPTTLTGYGITDAVDSFGSLTNKPTTLAGYGITDAGSGSLDSSLAVQLIDSAYVSARSSTTLNALTDVNAPSPTNGQALVYNTATSKWIPGAGGGGGGGAVSVDSAFVQSIITQNGVVGQYLPSFVNYKFSADSGQTVFAGTDANGEIFKLGDSNYQVFNNGIRLVNLNDYTVNSSTNTLTTTYGLDSGDEIIVNTIENVLVGDALLANADATTIIDSSYVLARSSAGVTTLGALTDVNDSGKALNSILLYNGSGSWVSGALPASTDSGAVIQLVDSAYVNARTQLTNVSNNYYINKTTFQNYQYTADSGQTVFTGADNNGKTLTVEDSNFQVFNNGIRLLSGNDYIMNAATNTLTLAAGFEADSGDDFVINVLNQGTAQPPNLVVRDAYFQDYKFIAGPGQVNFSGNDYYSNSLSFESDNLSVFLNGIKLSKTDDFTINPNSNVISLNTSTYDSDELVVTVIKNKSSGSGIYVQTDEIQAVVDSAYIQSRISSSAGTGTDSAAVINLIDSAYINSRVGATAAVWSEVTTTPLAAVANQRLILDTSGGVKVVNLPSSATLGDEIRIIDGTGNASTNNITIGRNGHKIEGTDSDLTIDVDRAAFGLVYYNTAQGWLFTEK